MRASGLVVLAMLLLGGWLVLAQRDDAAAVRVVETGAGVSPEATVTAYLAAMAAGRAGAASELYTPATLRMMRDRPLNRGQMRQLAAAYSGCRPERVLIAAARAVVRYPSSEPLCAPFFLLRGPQGWRLDLDAMSRAIGFDTGAAWHWTAGVPAAFAFGFSDWRFDPQGYPTP